VVEPVVFGEGGEEEGGEEEEVVAFVPNLSLIPRGRFANNKIQSGKCETTQHYYRFTLLNHICI